ncbi:hypothetical protein RchiOBHm_Chr6g0265261 [Rosa chinensis]|uniref:Uncharacterized protein n=1 Tax=Rosa chinensis TaxID=74649 RepID=A0A2P6PPE4_ROSCH|nr:hypothetical protein RchiOBHm_Chr6g0265261 [Rosa chinensis]
MLFSYQIWHAGRVSKKEESQRVVIHLYEFSSIIKRPVTIIEKLDHRSIRN